MSDILPPLADIGDVIKWGIGVLVFVFWIVGQIMGEKKAPAAPKKQPQPRRMPAPPPPGAGRPPPPRQQPVGGDPLADEIEQFLRRAAGKGGQKRAGAEAVEVLVPEKKPRRLADPLRSESRQPLTPRRPLSEVQPPRPGQTIIDPAADVGDSVALHVREHIESGGFAERVSHLGEDVGLADDRVESRLHQKFDHKVGRLVHREAGPGDAAKDQGSPFAESIVTMFQNPESVRQVIVLNEVLKRPEERW